MAGVLIVVESVQVVVAQTQVYGLPHTLLGIVRHLGDEEARAGDRGFHVQV